MFDSIEHVFKIREIFLLKINFGRKKKKLYFEKAKQFENVISDFFGVWCKIGPCLLLF